MGILHSVNQQESTVSLEHVQSFGTEGRRGGEEIPPSDQIFEYIVFRGSDIKDLQVITAPPPQVMPDPVMMQQYQQYQPQVMPMNPYMMQQQQMAYQQQQYWHQQQQYAPPPPQQSAVDSLNMNGLDITDQKTPERNVTRKPKETKLAETKQIVNGATEKAGPKKSSAPKPVEKANAPENPQTSRDSAPQTEPRASKAFAKVAEQNISKPEQELRSDQQSSKSEQQPRPEQSRPQSSSRGRGRNNYSQKSKIPIPDTDFDFQSSNAKFDKNELDQEHKASADYDSDDLTKENYYEKSTSFFDNISCEAKDRAEGIEYGPFLTL